MLSNNVHYKTQNSVNIHKITYSCIFLTHFSTLQEYRGYVIGIIYNSISKSYKNNH